MSLGGLGGKERTALLVSLGLVGLVFASAVFSYLNPPLQVWEVEVFQVFHEGDSTIVYSDGNGKLKLAGVYEFEVGETYRVTYKSRTRNAAEFDILVEKIS